jgi:dephospho-CoA kinase
MDRLIVVTSTEAQQVERLRQRDGATREQALAILASQMGAEEKVKVADFVIRNEGSLEETKKRAREIFRELRRMARERKGGAG